MSHADVAAYFSSGKEAVYGLHNVLAALRPAGIYLEFLEVPEAAVELIEAVKDREADDHEKAKLFDFFLPSREEILANISAAGREPMFESGGVLETKERASETRDFPLLEGSGFKNVKASVLAERNQKKGKLHLKTSSLKSLGVDEQQIFLRGQPTTLFFVMPDGDVVKLIFDYIAKGGPALLVNFCAGRVAHAEFANSHTNVQAPDGEKAGSRLTMKVCIGQPVWNARYRRQEGPWYKHRLLLGTNPWIHFGDKGRTVPRLLDFEQLHAKDEL